MTLCFALHQPRPLPATARDMPDRDPSLVHVFHRGQKRTRNARGIWKSHTRQSAAQRRDRSDSAAHHIPHPVHRRPQSSSVASSSTTTSSFGRIFDDPDVLDRYGDGNGDELDLDALSLNLHLPSRSFKRQRRSVSRDEPAGEASPSGRFYVPSLKPSSFASPASSSSTLLSCALPEDAKFPSGPGMNIPLPVPLDQHLSNKRTKTFCDWRDWEDLKETFASAAEDCECACRPHFYRSISTTRRISADNSSRALATLRAVVHECHRFIQILDDPSILFTSRRTQLRRTDSDESAHDLTPPEERLNRDWGVSSSRTGDEASANATPSLPSRCASFSHHQLRVTFTFSI